VLLALLWLAWKGGSPSLSPRQTAEEKREKETVPLLAALGRREKVTLIGASGPPLTSWWLPHRSGIVDTPRNGDDLFRIRAEKPGGMLELLPAAPERFRFRADVQHSESWDVKDTPNGQVGIYFGYGNHRVGEVTTHHFFRVTFNDRTPDGPDRLGTGPLNQVRLTFLVYHEKGNHFYYGEQSVDGEVYRSFTPAGKSPSEWRRLDVEVTPERIKTFWGGQLMEFKPAGQNVNDPETEIDGCDPRVILERAAHLTAGSGLLTQTLSGGLGLYVEKGIAAFRFVEVKPLP
jgi:hypothetical protein